MKMSSSIVVFSSSKDPFSGLYQCTFDYNGLRFNSSEQCYQYLRAKHKCCNKKAMKIIMTKNPLKCCIIGRTMGKKSDTFWRDRYDIKYMQEATNAKILSCKLIRDLLMSTGNNILCYASKRDRYWGVGMGCDDHRIFVHDEWLGRNELGNILMRIRDQLGYMSSK